MVIILLQRCEAELNARVWMEGGKLIDPGRGQRGKAGSGPASA